MKEFVPAVVIILVGIGLFATYTYVSSNEDVSNLNSGKWEAPFHTSDNEFRDPYLNTNTTPYGSDINSFEECIEAGFPAMESYPRQCRTDDGKHFVEEATIKINDYLSDIEFEGRAGPEILTESEKLSLPECADVLYTHLPVNLEEIESINPIGNVDPPGHTIPTNHMYMHLFQQNTQTTIVPLISPADIWITNIQASEGVTMDPIDYTIYFAVCKDVTGYYNHVKEVSPEIQKIIDDECNGKLPDNNKCFVQTLSPVEAGTQIGGVGRLQGNFDFGTMDFRTNNGLDNPERYATRTKHIQCPIDYYDKSNKEKLEGLLLSDGYCGKVFHDVPGTIKGNWFFEDGNEFMPGAWHKTLFLGDDDEDPKISVISVGGIISDPLRWMFEPENSGTVNVKFDKVAADGKVYCYDKRLDDSNGVYNKGPEGKILVELVNENEMKIERQDGSCSDGSEFVSPTTYQK